MGFRFLILLAAVIAATSDISTLGVSAQDTPPNRTVLPPLAPEFKGKIGPNYKESTPDFSPALPVTAPEGAPNVLVIVLDDVGYGHLGCYGGPIATPNIDNQAEPLECVKRNPDRQGNGPHPVQPIGW